MTTHAADWIDDAIAALPVILTAAEAMTLLRTSKRNLYRLVASGKLRAVRPTEAGSSRLLIPRASVESYLRRLDGSERAA